MTATAGGEHTLYQSDANSSNGEGSTLYSAGACGLGWCRSHPLNAALFQFRKVPLPEPARLVHASYYHNLAVGATSGSLYSWGCGTFTDGGMDGVIPALGGSVTTDRGEPPTKINFTSDDKNDTTTIVDITGGAYHSAVLMRSGTIWTFGAGQLGQLGRIPSQQDSSGLPVDPTPAPARGVPSIEKVRSIGAGFYNTFAICQSGSLYCTGENQNLQCGQGAKNLQTLTKVKEVSNVDQVEGGYCHTLVKTLQGQVYSLGCGDDGQRGDGQIIDDDDDSVKRPVVAAVELPTFAKQVAAGANHSVVLGNNGVAYTFGANDVGQCGVPSDTLIGDEDNEGGPVVAPKPVLLPNGVGKVLKVSAGYAHTVLTTESGKVFVFGQNDSGQLGTGATSFEKDIDPEPQTTPLEMNIPLIINPEASLQAP